MSLVANSSDTLTPVPKVDLARMGEAIRAEREAQGISQAELGARMVPPRHQVVVGGIERGENQLKAHMLEQVCKALLGEDGFAIMQIRAGWIDLDLPMRELLAADRRLTERGRRLAQHSYDLVLDAQAVEEDD